MKGFFMSQFDPNAASTEDSGIFGLPYTQKESRLVFLPVPWEATTSYGGGTSKGPESIFEASHQVDLFDLEVEKPYEAGMYFLPVSKKILGWNREGKKEAQKIIRAGGRIEGKTALKKALTKVNDLGRKVNAEVKAQSQKVLNEGKILALVGGDHSTPFGALQAMAEKEKSFGILHIDAHSDTRNAFEGFEWSHASIMYNVMENIPEVKKLVQVGIRDFCEEEFLYIQNSKGKIKTFFDQDLAKHKANGKNWNQLCEQIVNELPEKVWISFDIDGLDPRFCPGTGTPVPGGLDFWEAVLLISAVAKTGKKIIGFDLNEVSPSVGEWDANVGARMLYKMSAWCLASQGICKIRSP
jgi:agmatinase